MKKMLILSLFAAGFLGLAGAASAHGMFGWGNITPEELTSRQQAMFADQAALLGLSADQLKAAWAEGKTLPEIAAANNISKEELAKRLEAKRAEQQVSHLKALVDKGVITQAQADSRAKFMAAVPQKKGMAKGFGRGLGRMGW